MVLSQTDSNGDRGKQLMYCWHCNTELNWVDEYLIGHEDDVFDLETHLHCPNCKCNVVIHYPTKERLDESS